VSARVLGTFEGHRQLYRVEKSEDGRTIRHVAAGAETFEFTASVDLGALAAMAIKAAANRSGKSRDGALEVQVIPGSRKAAQS